MNIQDSLDRESSQFNLSNNYSNGSQSASAKLAMQNLYRQQLDDFLQSKNKMKEKEKLQKQAEKLEFNERALNNKQSEKLKDQAYKNYYNMLLNNQQQLQSSYVSPYSIRDSMKDNHITYSLEEGQKRMKLWEIQQRRREQQRKNSYRDQLLKQLEQKRMINDRNKMEESRNKEQYRKYGMLPQQLEEYEKKKMRVQMDKYREDLDKVKQEQDYYKKRSMSLKNNKFYDQMTSHNPLVNPLPFNIQNPYILGQMKKQNHREHRGPI